MLTKEYILECLEKFCNFNELTEDNFYEQIIVPLKDNMCFNSWDSAQGVTKGVLIFNELDYVVKIPFRGEGRLIEEHWEGECGTWYSYNTRHCDYSKTPAHWTHIDEEDTFEEFCGAEEPEGWNYCQVEKEIAEKAKNSTITNCFAKTSFLGYANGYPIYIQEHCTIYCDEQSSRYEETYRHRTKNDYDSLKEVRERVDFWNIDDNWLLDFLIYWGEEMLKNLAEFIFKENIQDLHCGNIGYRKGVPVLVDYSSFNG